MFLQVWRYANKEKWITLMNAFSSEILFYTPRYGLLRCYLRSYRTNISAWTDTGCYLTTSLIFRDARVTGIPKKGDTRAKMVSVSQEASRKIRLVIRYPPPDNKAFEWNAFCCVKERAFFIVVISTRIISAFINAPVLKMMCYHGLEHMKLMRTENLNFYWRV